MKNNMRLKISLGINIVLCAALIFMLCNSSFAEIFSGSLKTTYKIQYEERNSLFEHVPTTHADVVFLGDSLTQNGLWDELFPDVSLVNRGIRGDTTSGVLKRLDNVIKLQPKKLFLMVGINDLHSGLDKERILSNYKKIVDTIKDRLPETKIYLESILPIQENKHRIKNKDVDDLNLGIRKLADSSNITYIDINSKLKADNNELESKYTVDGEHLKGNAYMIWVNIIKRYIYGGESYVI